MSSIKMKGLLKGLRYISQIFDEEEEEEMQIGFPTDVKHVAHIGWDGPSINSPSWMNEFKSPAPENASPSLQNGEANCRGVEDFNSASQDSSSKRSTVRDSPGRDPPGLPKSSRRQMSNDSIGSTDSPMESPNHKMRSSRRRHKQKEITSPRGGESSSSQGLPNIPKKSRRKKSKDGEGSLKSSTKTKEKSSRHSRQGSDDGSLTKQCNGDTNSNMSMDSPKEGEIKEL